jgi:hypothetical protein
VSGTIIAPKEGDYEPALCVIMLACCRISIFHDQGRCCRLHVSPDFPVCGFG